MDTFYSITSKDKIVSDSQLNSVGGILTKLLPYIYVAAGLYLLVILIWGGIILMTAAGDQNKMKEGYGKITAGIIGFVIIFVSYFVAQIVQVILGVKFL